MSTTIGVKTTPAIQRTEATPIAWRWVAVSVFMFASVLNFLDRQLLAAFAPMLKNEFHLSNADYGALISAFSLAYMVMVPIAGLLIDRVGLRLGAMVTVTAWSIVGMATGVTRTFGNLLACRMALGVAESGGIPSSSKATATYLQTHEFGIGHALQAGGVSIGAIIAPLVAAAMMPIYGWRGSFVLCGGLGLLWTPLWWFTSRRIPGRNDRTSAPPMALREMLADQRIWGLLLTNVLIMTVHSLWSNWITVYFVQERHLTLQEANQYFAWIPPVFASLGGFFGGWLAFRRIRSGGDPIPTRLSVCYWIAPTLLVTAVIPFMPTASAAAAAISLSFFMCLALLTNLHTLPMDLFGARHAAFTAALLSFSYALLQAVISPIIGALVDRIGFSAVFITMSALPLIGVGVLRFTMKQAHESLPI